LLTELLGSAVEATQEREFVNASRVFCDAGCGNRVINLCESEILLDDCGKAWLGQETGHNHAETGHNHAETGHNHGFFVG
jgi:hypothetical protein